jgi:hypothetical protein
MVIFSVFIVLRDKILYMFYAAISLLDIVRLTYDV